MAPSLFGVRGADIVSEPWQIQVFGVRHLSPSGAWHLQKFLEKIRPELVLVEGLADATDLTKFWVKKGTKPPIAVLAYTKELPIRTLVYPMARYSPEFQAVLWAHQHHVPVEFFDLPSDIFLGLQDLEYRAANVASGDSASAPEDDEPSSEPEPEAIDETGSGSTVPEISLYERVALQTGDSNYDTYWERNFEHNLSPEAYRLAAFELGSSLREMDEDSARRRAESLIREAYMRRRVEEAIADGVRPEKIVAVVGAFHAPVLNGQWPALSDTELSQLPRRDSHLTLMPYSYFRLSAQSGYGAGNPAPAYFELMWDALLNDDLPGLAGHYLSLVARKIRQQGTHRSTAEVIEGVRLARTLAAMHGGQAPTLSDLHDAAVTLLGHGELGSIAEALAHVDVGTAIGQLPDGVSRTSIQEDFDRELLRLKLTKYRSTVRQDLDLDLRENRQAKSSAAAFLDLSRSAFLHRLRVLDVKFAEFVPTRQQAATWAENWLLQWSPESEITLVESVLLGETVELATGYKLKQKIDEAQSIEGAAALVADACQCDLPTMMESARRRLQGLANESSALVAVAEAAFRLLQVVRYGDVRRFDTQPLVPLIEELFVQGTLGLLDAAQCDAAAAKGLMGAMDQLNRIVLEFSERIDEALWRRHLQALADADDRSPILSGLACALLLERGWMDNDALGREVSRRLSPGIAADLGAGWFEGLASRNRYALIARQVLWEQLTGYISQLDDEEFRRSLVFLRRAFGAFSPNEKRSIAENLANIWGVDAEQAAEELDGLLNEAEEQALADLNDFDFD
ncbi:MAG: DUF5682 family protein [Pirellulaceae bacterium]|nr:DUF5682 family protein [Pirellulaceae bacterium]